MFAYRRLVVRRRVLVNLVTGRAVEGVVVSRIGPLLSLKDARLHEPGAANPIPVDGELVVHRLNIDFIQVCGERLAI